MNKVPVKIRNQAPNTQRQVKGLKRCKDKTEKPVLLVPLNQTPSLSKRYSKFSVEAYVW